MTIFLFLLALLVILNVRATKRALCSNEAPFKRNMMIAGVWIIPFIGALTIKAHTRPLSASPANEADIVPLPGIISEPAPTELCVEGLPVLPLSAGMVMVNRIPFLHWDTLVEWAFSVNNKAVTRAALEASKRAWLMHLRDAFGPHYRLCETEETYLLSPLENRVAIATAAYVNTTRAKIQQVLAGVARFPPNEKSVLLVMDGEDRYYDYISCYGPQEGEFAFSSGMFLNEGHAHFVVQSANLAAIEPVIVHEMTHSALTYLNLPLWLDEGLAVNTENRLAISARPRTSARELRQMHLDFWDEETIQEFWSGVSFHRQDEGNLLSYDLSRIIVEKISGDWDSFRAFVLVAKQDDAGSQAAIDHLHINLGNLICALFEKPNSKNWEPAICRV